MASRSDRILITGSSGMTGRALLDRLRDQGVVAVGLTRTPEHPWEVEGDLENIASLRRVVREVDPTVVVHMAGVTYAVHGDIAEIYQANVTGTASLLTAVRDLAQPRAVILASSATVYAPPVGDAPLVEDGPLLPGSHYAASKLAMESVGRLFASDLPIITTRPFNYTGEGQSPQFLIPKIVDHFVRREPVIELGNLDLYRDFSDIRTVTEAYLRLIEIAPVGLTLNLCSGRALHLTDLIEALCEIAGYRIEVRTNPAFVRPDEPRTILGSTALMDATLGALRPPPIADTLGRMYQAGRATLGDA